MFRDSSWVAAWHVGRAVYDAWRLMCNCTWCRYTKSITGTRLRLRDTAQPGWSGMEICRRVCGLAVDAKLGMFLMQ